MEVKTWAAAAALLLISGCSGSPEESRAPVALDVAQVLYEVEGTVSWADVTLATPTGTSQLSPDVPLTRKGTSERGLTQTFPSGSFVYISAQMKDDVGRITCRITVDGVVVSENSSSAAFGIATCKGRT